MTTLLRPVLIESAEQAEALPPRTPVLMGPFVAHRPYADQGWVVTDEGGEYGSEELIAAHSHLNPTALVPIEAEEEWKTLHEGAWHLKDDEDDARQDANSLGARRRYTTDWEEA